MSDGACRALYSRRVCLVDGQALANKADRDLIHSNEHRVEDRGGAIPAIHIVIFSMATKSDEHTAPNPPMNCANDLQRTHVTTVDSSCACSNCSAAEAVAAS